MDKQIINNNVLGFLEARGCFTFSSSRSSGKKCLTPSCVITGTKDDEGAMALFKKEMRLKTTIHSYSPKARKDGYIRRVILVMSVRDLGQLKNNLLPKIHRRLTGLRAEQYFNWLKQIETDLSVSKSFKILPKLFH